MHEITDITAKIIHPVCRIEVIVSGNAKPKAIITMVGIAAEMMIVLHIAHEPVRPDLSARACRSQSDCPFLPVLIKARVALGSDTIHTASVFQR